ncbi:MAG: polysaccharide deacetylase family protein [Bacteroidetes bacterium]|nr:polysaccharide deacetylase family protein [Bacteroidota bacterium]
MAVLAYHKVDNRFELGVTTVKPEVFFKQIGELQKRGYEIHQSTGRDAETGDGVCLTFDDGYDCFYRNVAPFLTSLHVGATVFVVTDFIGRTNEWDIRLSYRPFVHMDKNQIREVAELGFEVGSHSCSHRDLTRLDRTAVSNELVNSKKQIEDMLGREVRTVSFPFGRHNADVVALAKEAGYDLLFGLGSSVEDGVIRRIPVYRFDGAAAVRRKVAMNKLEIMKGDLVHSFAYLSSLLSVRHARRTV